MKTIFTLCICLAASLSQSQTSIIAHKSHSGTAIDFFVDPNSNFGEPGPRLIQIVRLNDSTYIEVYSEFSGMIYHDTIRKNRKISTYNEDIDSIYQQEYYKHIEYINLKHTADTGRVKAPSMQLQQLIKDTELSPQESDYKPVQEPNPKKKKKSYLLFLFGITGGGLLILRILKQAFSPQIAS
ncbi:hypothetical protein [Fluviicola chungangensis]|uniref:Uncharacterized protein n=1 Tax=Fluviicola chungangensis TaxID=2597671 RepID=A0A556N7I5_9FLAO|nr:hypothetical protein [Fluviicola chungangensis]TSJ48081.1 hypothetical protein FO442_02810 [Fluviicola chungangensis]